MLTKRYELMADWQVFFARLRVTILASCYTIYLQPDPAVTGTNHMQIGNQRILPAEQPEHPKL
jgi:hypothetical protein